MLKNINDSYQIESRSIVIDVDYPNFENCKTGFSVPIRRRHRNVVSVFLLSVERRCAPNLSGVFVELEKSGRQNFRRDRVADVVVSIVVDGRHSSHLNSFGLVLCKVDFEDGLGAECRGVTVGRDEVDPQLGDAGVDPVWDWDVEEVAGSLVEAVQVDKTDYSGARVHGKDLKELLNLYFYFEFIFLF